MTLYTESTRELEDWLCAYLGVTKRALICVKKVAKEESSKSKQIKECIYLLDKLIDDIKNRHNCNTIADEDFNLYAAKFFTMVNVAYHNHLKFDGHDLLTLPAENGELDIPMWIFLKPVEFIEYFENSKSYTLSRSTINVRSPKIRASKDASALYRAYIVGHLFKFGEEKTTVELKLELDWFGIMMDSLGQEIANCKITDKGSCPMIEADIELIKKQFNFITR